MKPVNRISLKDAREKALPILLAGYHKRRKLRSSAESALRAPEKVARDNNTSAKPHLSAI